MLGFTKKKHQDWFDNNQKEINLLISQKREACLSFESHPTSEKLELLKETKKTCQRRLRNIQNKWWMAKAAEIQMYADRWDMRRFYATTKEIFGPTRSSVGGLKDAGNTTTLTDPTSILDRWKSHFEALLNNHTATPDDSLKNTPQLPPRTWMSAPPTDKKFRDAFGCMKIGKASGPNNILFEILAHGGPDLKERLWQVIYACETWTLYQCDIKQLEGFQQAKLRNLLHIHWTDCVTNIEILN